MKKMFIVLFGLNVIIFLLSMTLSSGSQSFKIAQNLKVYAELGGGSHKCNPDGDYWLTWPWNCPDCGAELNGCFWSGDPEWISPKKVDGKLGYNKSTKLP